MIVLCYEFAIFVFFFFFQAEDGIRDHCVTGVQTCALPIWAPYVPPLSGRKSRVERWYTNAWSHSDYVHGSFYDHTLYDTDKFRPVKFCDDLVCISGTMGNDKHTTIQITVYPAANMTHLADGLYQEYQKAAEFHG